MGHEELVMPMLILGSVRLRQPPKLGRFWHCLNEQFKPNNLTGTAAVGAIAGDNEGGVHLGFMLPGTGDEWETATIVRGVAHMDSHNVHA
jgi:hypothetical protein